MLAARQSGIVLTHVLFSMGLNLPLAARGIHTVNRRLETIAERGASTLSALRIGPVARPCEHDNEPHTVIL
jgi:hypothetical protein